MRTRKPILPNFGAPALDTPSAGTPEGAAAQTMAAAATTAVARAIAPDEAAELRRQAEEGLEARLAQHGTADGLTEQDYRDRLDFEIRVITNMKFPGYFLIVSDFIKWAKDHDIPVGPGRGSGAGSLVAWSLLITDLDPLRFGLLFERFLNPERVSMPDFDIDFCVEGRERVIRYVQERYGERQVGQIITFGTLLARGVLRDVGRVLEMPYGQVDKLTKLVPQNPANPVTLAQAIEGEPKLQSAMEEEPVVARLIQIARKLEGLQPARLDPRRRRGDRGPAAGGAGPALPRPEDRDAGHPVQHEVGRAGRAGEVRLPRPQDPDGAARRHRPAAPARHRGRPALAADRRPAHLRAAAQGRDGRGVPGGIGRHAQGAGRDVRRPFRGHHRAGGAVPAGPMANIPVYCERKLGRDAGNEKNWYPHETLEPILRETFGIIVYQEQ